MSASESAGRLAGVRTAARAVADRARSVRIARDRLAEYAASLPADVLAAPSLDPAFHYLREPAGTAAFLIALDAINFGSGYFPTIRKRPGCSGYFTVALSLKERFDRAGPLSAADLAALTPADCAAIFGQDLAGPPGELMALFARALNDLGRLLIDRYQGDFLALIAAADRSAERLVDLLIEMPFFDDVSRYDDLTVPFYKRAQLTAADLAIAFAGSGPGAFTDLDRLTIFADNLVPHVLRIDGILRYDPDLAARIEREELIAAGSPEEIEIRAGAVHAVELLVEHLARLGRPANAHQLDYLLWNRGQQPAYKAIPRHRARTTAY